MSKKYLGLIGPEDSVYLRLIQRGAEKAGLPVLRVSQRDERCGCYVIDSEAGETGIRLTAEEDIDCVQHPGLSCVAEAALWYFDRMSIPYETVGLIGRGHAVQGLAEKLAKDSHTVLPCNQAMDPVFALRTAQIIINSAPIATLGLLDAVGVNRSLIIDISGALEPLPQRAGWKGAYVKRGDIGKKNVEILLNRAREALEILAETYDNVNHPKHYCREGGMENIEEMVLAFGREAVMHFCLCNVWKYRYRASDKNREEDLKKSDWYMRKYRELAANAYISYD